MNDSTQNAAGEASSAGGESTAAAENPNALKPTNKPEGIIAHLEKFGAWAEADLRDAAEWIETKLKSL